MGSSGSLNHVYRTVWNQALGAMVAIAEIASGGRNRRAGSVRLRAQGGPSAWRLKALPLGIALAWASLSGGAMANPTGGVAIVGQASMTTNGNQLLVTTQNGAGTNHSAINWQSFSIPSGNTTHFQQPSSASTVINRVVSNTPSAIYGTLSSNGQVVLVNQSGIAVGAGALVDTAGFTASSLHMSDADAMAGRLRFGDGSSVSGNVSVQGQVLARSGDVVLLGSNVDTGKGALIQAPNGSTILAAGEQIEITGRGLEGIALKVQAPSNQAVNLGTLQAGAVGIFAGTLRHSGAIQATRASLEGGKVVLKAAGDALVEGAGTIVASGTRGGSIDVLGQRVAVTDQAVIDVSGADQGGVVRVGGDYQGKNPDVQNAQATFLGSEASVKADATGNGNGGRVIVWSDDTTRVHGSISARGGASGGDGGFVETSGKQSLIASGARVDTRANTGATGLWLLDPNNIDIISGSTLNVTGTPNFVSSGAGTLSVSDLLTALGASNVSVTATDNLTVSAGFSDSGSNSLSLKAQNGTLALNAPITLGSGSLGLESTSGSMTLGANVSLTSGTLKLKSGGTISQSTGTLSASSMEVTAGGAVSLNSSNSVGTLAASVSSGGFSYKGAAALTVGSVGSINGITTSGSAIALEGDYITIDQGVNAGSGSVTLKSIGSNISNSSNGVITAGSLTLNPAHGVSLTGAANSVGNLTVTTSGTEPVSYLNSGALTVSSISAVGTVNLMTGGAVSQTGAITVSGGALTVNSASGNVTLTNASNNLSALGVSNGGVVSVQNSGGIDLYSVSASSFKLKANGNITINSGSVTTSAGGIDIAANGGSISSAEGILATGGAVKLSATNGMSLSFGSISSDAAGDAVIFINTGGLLSVSSSVTTSGAGGRWLAYVPSMTSNVFPSGMAFKQYNATYGSTVLGTGNGVLVSAAPVLTLSSTTVSGSVSKVYDGGTGIGIGGVTLPTITGGTIDGDLISGAVYSASSGSLDDKNVGSGKLVSVNGSATGITTSGSLPVYGYKLPAVTGAIGTVTQRPTSTWNGGGSNLWSYAGNWDVLPDGANVASVVIPAGVGPIVFDASVGNTTLQSLNSGSPILVTGGALQVSSTLSAAGFAQSGGSVVGGTLKVIGAFNQTGGSVDMTAIDVLTPTGGIAFSSLKAPVVKLVASNGSITQTGGVTTAALTTSSTGGTVLNGPGNQIVGAFTASNAGSGSVELTNTGVISSLTVSNAAGNVVVSNVGGITTQSVSASGNASITANSPLTVEGGGISAGGNVTLTATNLTSSGNLTLNAPVSSSGGSVALVAASNLAQNSSVYGAAGVSATVGGSMTLGPGATSGASPVSYTVAGAPVTPPPTVLSGVPPTTPTTPTTPGTPTVPTTPTTPTPPTTPTTPVVLPTIPGGNDPVTTAAVGTNLVATFLDKFETALQKQIDDVPGKDKNHDGLVIEGDVCSR